MTDLLIPSRRSFLTGLAAAIAAPAIVRPASLMPVKIMIDRRHRWLAAYCIGTDSVLLRADTVVDEFGNLSAPPMPVKGVYRLTERMQRKLDERHAGTRRAAPYRHVDWNKKTRCRAQYNVTTALPYDVAEELSAGGVFFVNQP